MTRVTETAKRTVAIVKRENNGWEVVFIDGSCRLITKNQKKGTTPIEPGMIIKSCRTHCDGPDENGKCTLRPRGPRANNAPNVKCKEQFVYVYKPNDFGTFKPKFTRTMQIISYKIKTAQPVKRRVITNPEKWRITFEDGTTKTVLKSDILGHKAVKAGNHLIPCGEECLHRDGACIHCFGEKRGTECAQQFYFCRKFLSRHKYNKQK